MNDLVCSGFNIVDYVCGCFGRWCCFVGVGMVRLLVCDGVVLGFVY